MQKLIRKGTLVTFGSLLLVFLVCTGVNAQERLCDPAFEDCRAPLWSLIDNETVGIDVAFWFMQDTSYANKIIAKHQQGVPVRILVDPRANPIYNGNEQVLNMFANAGIPMRYNINDGILHWKMMMFVGQNKVQFSGANYSPAFFVPTTPFANYIDEAIYFTDDPSVVNSFKTKYDDLWTNTTRYANYANISGPLTRRYPTFPLDPELNWSPDNGDTEFANRSVYAYSAEMQKIDVIMYRITDQRHTNALIAAVARGVPVRLLTEPQEYRNPAKFWHSWNVDRMYVAGVQVKNRNPQRLGLNHEKAVVLHGQKMSIFGSSNWTTSSSNSQEEHNYFTRKQWIFDWFVNHFERKWNATSENSPFVPQPPPDQPAYSFPQNAATGVTNLTLEWEGGIWAHKYDIYFGTTPNPPLLAADVFTGSPYPGNTETYELPPLTLGTTYYWRIVSKTMANLGLSGPTWSFTTSSTPVQESPNNTRVPPASQIVDSVGAVWTRAANGAILRNGSSAAGGFGSEILYCDRIVYVLGTDSRWYRWNGSWTPVGLVDPCAGATPAPSPTPTPTPTPSPSPTPTPTPTPTPSPTPTPTPGEESPNNTRLPPADQIVDSTGAVWTRTSSGAILRNGVSAAGGVGSEILYCNRIIYVLGTDSQWWRWNSGWTPAGFIDPCSGGTPTPTPTPTPAPTPTPTPSEESANNTRVPPATQIVDSTGAVWTRTANGTILRNGGGTGGTGSQILYCNRIVYVLGTDSQWWRWNGGWTPVGFVDPCAGATPTPTPTPAPPTVSNVSPASGPTFGGTSITITGTGFLTGATVSLDSTFASNVTVVNSTSITALTPAHTAGPADVVVTNTDGLGGTKTGGFTYFTPPTTVPSFDRVFIVVLENQSFENVIGSSSMPYLNAIANRYGLAVNYFANTQPSIGDYFWLTTGQVITNDSNFTGVVTEDNIVRQLNFAGKSWRAYAESLPSVGYIGGDVYPYVKRHNPFAYFSDVRDNSVQANNLVPFTQFASDLAGNQLPNYSFIIPNQQNNAHDCPAAIPNCTNADKLAAADSWLKTNIDPLISSAAFRQSGMLVITFDESIKGDTQHGGGHIATVVISTRTPQGFGSNSFYQHQNTLRLIGEGVGLMSYPGAAATAANMSEFFGTASNTAPSITSVSPASGATTGGTTVTISGTGFATGATVSFGGTAAGSVNVLGSTRIEALAPAHASGAVNVVVTNPGGEAATLVNGYTYNSPPGTETVLLADDFNDGSIDNGKWIANNLFSGFTDSTVALQETTSFRIGPLKQNVGGSHYNGLKSAGAFNFTGGYAYVQLVQAPSASTAANAFYTIGLNVDNCYRMYVEAGTLFVQSKIGGVKQALFSVTYNPTNHAFWRIRHDATTGHVVFEAAPENGSAPGAWVQLAAQPWNTAAIPLTSVTFELKGGTWRSEANNPGTVVFDNFKAARP